MDMRSAKGVTPIIATILLVSIATATATVVYSYMGGISVLPEAEPLASSMLESLKTVGVKGSSNGIFDVYIMNVGNIDSVIDVFYVKDFTGVTVATIPVNVSIAIGQIVDFQLDTYLYGDGPWSWYEIRGITARGNRFDMNLFASQSGAQAIGELPEGETDSLYPVVRVIVNGTDVTTDGILQNLTYVDGKFFDVMTGKLVFNEVSSPATAVEFDFDAGSYNIYHYDVDNLRYAEGIPNSANVVKVNLHNVDSGSGSMMSITFSGSTSNSRYSSLVLSFGFDMNTAAFNGMNGTVQFWDWNTNQYVISGNGYWAFNSDDIYWDTYGSNMRNFSVIMDLGALTSPNGEWSIMLNLSTNKKNVEIKFDYLHVKEVIENVNGIDTLFCYQLVGIDESAVTKLLFSTTGIFSANSDYNMAVFNFDTQSWNYFNVIKGSSELQTVALEVSSSCASYINSTNFVIIKISPIQGSTSVETIFTDQSRLIVRTIE